MRLSDCFKEGLLKKTTKDIEKARRSIEIARHRLEVAKIVLDSKIYEDSIIDAYSAMFHAGRALLFKDGVKERSHYALYIYLKEVYKDKIEPRFINEFNSLRMERHEILYGLDLLEYQETETMEIISIAEDFINSVEKIISQQS